VIRNVRRTVVSLWITVPIALVLAACGGGDEGMEPSATGEVPKQLSEPAGTSTDASAEGEIDGLFEVAEGRSLYLRCTGSGSPTLLLEGGDGDNSDSYAFAESTLADVTRTCVYDRANLGMSDPAPGPRLLEDFVGDLEALLDAADVPPPYVLVGTSGGGFLTAGYAVEHRSDIAGMVFIDTGQPLENPPAEIEEFTAWDHPENIEQRDYLQIENAAWDARRRIGDIPVTIVTVEYSKEEIAQSPFPVEQAAMLRNVERQQGWLVLSPRAEQIVVHTGHAVEEDDPQLVIDVILDVLGAAARR